MKKLKLSTLGLLLLLSINGNAGNGINYSYSYSDKTASVEGPSYGNYNDSIIIPDTIEYIGKTYTVTTIDKYAFDDNTKIKYIKLPETIENIKDYSFRNCTNLETVILPSNLISIGNFAFYGCSNLTSISIPQGTTTIGTKAFTNCRKLSSIDVDNTNENYMSEDGVLFNKDKTTLITCPGGKSGSYIISSNTTNIENSAFQGCNSLIELSIPFVGTADTVGTFLDLFNSKLPPSLKKVNITEPCTTIGYRDFANCSTISEINLPITITNIAEYAFANCSTLEEITIPENITTIGEDAFENCTSLQTINFNAINAQNTSPCFSGCTNLNTLKIGNKVTTIKYLFVDCKTLNGTLDIPNSVTSIDSSAFDGCSGLTGTLKIPNSVTSIGFSAFARCSGFTGTLKIPDSITSIGDHAFNGCSGFTDTLKIPNYTTSIGGGAFYKCSGLTSITIGESVSSIGVYAFAECNSLTEVNFNAINTTAKYNSDDKVYTFNTCNALTSLNIGNKVQTIPECLFWGCSSLKGELIIPNSVTYIGSTAFYFCTNLSSVTIGESVRTIKSAFVGCDSVKIINYNAINCTETRSLVGDQFSSATTLNIGNKVQVIPTFAFSSTGSGTYTALKGELRIPNSVKKIGFKAFYGCNKFSSIKLGDSVTSIDTWAFGYCQKLKSLTIPKSVNSIGSSAFFGCTELSGCLRICGTLTSIKTTTFGRCSKLSSIIFESSIDTIFYHAFNGCNNLSSIIIKDTINSIGYLAFKDCNKLSSIINLNATPAFIDGYTDEFKVFLGVNKDTCKLLVPNSSVSLYKNATEWEEFSNILPLTNDTNTKNNATIEWQPYEYATGYRLTIFDDETHTDTLRIIEFDSTGIIINDINLRSTNEIPFSYTMSSLSEKTTYYYTIETLGEANVVLYALSNKITTLGTTTEIIETTTKSIKKTVIAYYSITGIKLPKEPESGAYIVLYDTGESKKIIKQ